MAKKRKTAKPARRAPRVARSARAPRAKTTAVRPRRAARLIRGSGCLGLVAAGEIVQAAIPGGPHDVGITLEDAGLITAGQRAVFRDDVVAGVSARGCVIDAGDVPDGATNTLFEVRGAVQQHARSTQ